MAALARAPTLISSPASATISSSRATGSSVFDFEGDGIAANVKDMEARLRAKEDVIRQLRRHLLDSENEKEECHRQMEEQTDRYTEISSEMLQRIEELEKRDALWVGQQVRAFEQENRFKTGSSAEVSRRCWKESRTEETITVREFGRFLLVSIIRLSCAILTKYPRLA